MFSIKNRHADSVMGAFNALQKTYSEHFSQVFKTIMTDSFVIWIFSYQCSTYYCNLRKNRVIIIWLFFIVRIDYIRNGGTIYGSHA